VSNLPLPQENKIYNYNDYMQFPENKKWELIDGIPYLQAAPTWQHQSILIELVGQLYNYFKGKPCKVFSAPFDLNLEGNDESKNVFQPDIVVVCDRNKLNKTGYFGVPSMIIEILSPSTAKRDKILKLYKYKQFGVNLYWIVEPDTKIIETYTLKDGEYIFNSYQEEDKKIKVTHFENLEIDLDIFK
jgi:Uma2 family endonuclease